MNQSLSQSFFARFECSKCVCDDSNITISLLKTYIFELKNKGGVSEKIRSFELLSERISRKTFLK